MIGHARKLRDFEARLRRHPDIIHFERVEAEWAPLKRMWRQFKWPKASRAQAWRKHCKGFMLLEVMEMRDDLGDLRDAM
jgi:hypothetical protein